MEGREVRFIHAPTESRILRMIKDYEDAGFICGTPWYRNGCWNCRVEGKKV
jgi:hypothetical protein